MGRSLEMLEVGQWKNKLEESGKGVKMEWERNWSGKCGNGVGRDWEGCGKRLVRKCEESRKGVGRKWESKRNWSGMVVGREWDFNRN